MQQGGYPGQAGYPGQYPEQYSRGQEYNQQYPQQGYPPSRTGPVYPQYPPPGPEGDNRSYPQGGEKFKFCLQCSRVESFILQLIL